MQVGASTGGGATTVEPHAAVPLAQLTRALAQLQLQFGGLAAALAQVVDQLDVLTNQQQQQQHLPPVAGTTVALVPTPDQALVRLAGKADEQAPRPADATATTDADDEAAPVDDEDELLDVVVESSSEEEDDDEECEQNLNRVMKQQDDEQENEQSETSGKGRETSISSQMRAITRRQPAKRAPKVIATTPVIMDEVAVSSDVPAGELPAQSHRSSFSVPIVPSPSAAGAMLAHAHTSPTLLSSLRRLSNQSIVPPHHHTVYSAPFMPPASATALPLDAPELTHRISLSSQQSTSPMHRAVSPGHVSSASATSSPLHRTHAHSVSVEARVGQHIFTCHQNKLKLNVGGQLFCTTLGTLLREPSSMFTGMFSGHFGSDDQYTKRGGAVFIDRDPTMFRHVLNYLRDGSIGLEGMTQAQKKALIKEARYFGLGGLLGLLQLDSRATKSAQRRELSNEKEYHLVSEVPQKEIANTIKQFTMMEGYEFENWLNAAPPSPASSKKSAVAPPCNVHLLFSKKLSRGELMLLDRLQHHM